MELHDPGTYPVGGSGGTTPGKSLMWQSSYQNDDGDADGPPSPPKLLSAAGTAAASTTPAAERPASGGAMATAATMQGAKEEAIMTAEMENGRKGLRSGSVHPLSSDAVHFSNHRVHASYQNQSTLALHDRLGGGADDGAPVDASSQAANEDGADHPPPPSEALLGFLTRQASDGYLVENLDSHFQRAYTYYTERGFWPIVLSRVTNLLTLAFTITFSTFLLSFVNWGDLLNCSSSEFSPASKVHQQACSDVDYLRRTPFSQPTFGDILVYFYFCIFSLYWLWNFFALYHTIGDCLEMSHFYRRLDISDEQLPHIPWALVVRRIILLQDRIQFVLSKRELTALDIANHIMRRENYMIALINQDVLHFSVPCLCSGSLWRWWHGKRRRRIGRRRWRHHNSTLLEHSPDLDEDEYDDNDGFYDGFGDVTELQPSTSDGAESVRGDFAEKRDSDETGRRYGCMESAMFGKSLEWNIRFFILPMFFTSDYALKMQFSDGDPVRVREAVGRLNRRFWLLGIFNLLLLPFVMLFMVMFFFLKNAEELHSKKSFLGPRQWTPFAAWRLREFNELPHFFEARLTEGSIYAQKYISVFPNVLVGIIARFFAYISGAIVAILLLLTFIDPDILLSVRVMDRTLLWYLALFSAVLALSRSFTPEAQEDVSLHVADIDVAANVSAANGVPDERAEVTGPEEAMAQVVKHTHYFPKHWYGKVHTDLVRSEFSRLYQPRLVTFFYEVLGAIFTPLVLLYALPRCSEDIVAFMRETSVQVEGMTGHLCRYSLLDLDSVERARSESDGGDGEGGGESDAAGYRVSGADDIESAGRDNRISSEAAVTQQQSMRELAASSAPEPADTSYQHGNGDRDNALESGMSSVRRRHAAVDSALKSSRRVRPDKDGKLMKSLLSFAIHHPEWRTNEAGSRMLSSIAGSVLLNNSARHVSPAHVRMTAAAMPSLHHLQPLSLSSRLTSMGSDVSFAVGGGRAGGATPAVAEGVPEDVVMKRAVSQGSALSTGSGSDSEDHAIMLGLENAVQHGDLNNPALGRSIAPLIQSFADMSGVLGGGGALGGASMFMSQAQPGQSHLLKYSVAAAPSMAASSVVMTGGGRQSVMYPQQASGEAMLRHRAHQALAASSHHESSAVGDISGAMSPPRMLHRRSKGRRGRASGASSPPLAPSAGRASFGAGRQGPIAPAVTAATAPASMWDATRVGPPNLFLSLEQLRNQQQLQYQSRVRNGAGSNGLPPPPPPPPHGVLGPLAASSAMRSVPLRPGARLRGGMSTTLGSSGTGGLRPFGEPFST